MDELNTLRYYNGKVFLKTIKPELLKNFLRDIISGKIDNLEDAETIFKEIESDYQYMSQNLPKIKGSDKEVYYNYIKDAKKLIFRPKENGKDTS